MAAAVANARRTNPRLYLAQSSRFSMRAAARWYVLPCFASRSHIMPPIQPVEPNTRNTSLDGACRAREKRRRGTRRRANEKASSTAQQQEKTYKETEESGNVPPQMGALAGQTPRSRENQVDGKSSARRGGTRAVTNGDGATGAQQRQPLRSWWLITGWQENAKNRCCISLPT